MARFNLTRSRIFGIGLATAALAFAACGHSSSNSTPTVTATATVSSVVTATSSPCVVSFGIAYEPDAGNGNGFTGIQETHYEGNDENTCAAGGPTATPQAVAFSSSVGQFQISVTGADGVTDAVAILKKTSGGYSLVQDVFGGASGTIVPAGSPYDVSIAPPTTSPSPGATASVAPLIPDITSLDTVGGGAEGLAIVTGPGASPPAFVAVTSLENAPPIYGLSVGYNDPTFTFTTAPNVPRQIVRLAPTTTSVGTTALARSQSDLLAFEVTNASASGYQFNAVADDTNLGSSVALRGNGNIGFDPADGTRALIGGTTAGNLSTLTLVTGLPQHITESAVLGMPGVINSIAVAANGRYAIVATSVGLVVVNGISSGTLSLVTPFSASPANASANAITYTNCNGTSSVMTDFYSVQLGSAYAGSTTLQFLVALGTAPGVTCPSGNDASLVAIPFNPTTGSTPVPTASPTASPVPTATAAGATPTPTPSPSPPPIFVQNNMIAPPAGADLLVVR